MKEKSLQYLKNECIYWKRAAIAMTLGLGAWIIWTTWALPVPNDAPPSYSSLKASFPLIIGILFLILVMVVHLHGYYHGQIDAREERHRSNSAIVVGSVSAPANNPDSANPSMLN